MADKGDYVLVLPLAPRANLRGLAGEVTAVRNDAGRSGEKQVCVDFAPVLGRGEHYFVDDGLVSITVRPLGR